VAGWTLLGLGYYLQPLLFKPEGDAALHDAVTGQVISNTGIPTTAAMPMFSPDGRLLAFNDSSIDNAHGLAVMNYDVMQDKATGYMPIAKEEDTSANTKPGWPSFLPDDKGVVFVRTDAPGFTAGLLGGQEATLNANTPGSTVDIGSTLPHADLYIVDLKTGTKTLLAKAMGFNTQADADHDATYLPFGSADLHHNYIPSVSPVAQGGYFWVFFDSLRHFGHLGVQRQLWVTAIDIQADGSYTKDVSHPPFYLPGQSFGIGNHRAFATLDACGTGACTTGIDCCPGTTCGIPQGAAINQFGASVGACAPPPPEHTCANLNERCTSQADCCDVGNYCINGFCAFVELK
jgi:hypothetical protein